MKRICVTEARDNFADTVNRVAYEGERLLLHRRGKNIVALVPVDDLTILSEIEDRIDLVEIKQRLARSKETIPLAEVRKKLAALLRK